MSQVGCKRCRKDAIECNCADMGDRLRNMARGPHAGAILDVIAQRQQLGKDLPTQCTGSPMCCEKPEWIPVVTMAAGPRVKQLTRSKTKQRVISAEMLNAPVCNFHRGEASLGKFVNEKNWSDYEAYFRSRGLSTPSPNRMKLTFRPLQRDRIIIAP